MGIDIVGGGSGIGLPVDGSGVALKEGDATCAPSGGTGDLDKAPDLNRGCGVSLAVGPWFAVQTRPNCAAIALRNLGRQSFATFAPTIGVTRRVRDAFRTVQAPLFPGYVFVAAGADGARWRAINSTYGVSRIVSFCGAPAALPVDFIGALMARCDGDGRILPEPEGPCFEVGECVRITTGPLAELVGEVVKLSSERRIVLLLDLLGGKTRVTVSADHLTK